MEIQILKPQNLINSMDSNREFGIFLLKVQATIHAIHWYVLNYNAHKILGSLYEDIDELFDKLQEEIIGTCREYNVVFPKINFQIPILNLDDVCKFNDDNSQILNIYFDVVKEFLTVLTSLEFNNFLTQVKSGIKNTVDEIISRFNKTNYLLSLIK